MLNLVGGLYPGLYDWLVEVPVEPPTEIPPGTCVTSDIAVRCLVTAEIESRVLVEACIQIDYSPVPKPEVPVLPMSCGIEVRQPIECETLEVRNLVTSECVEVFNLEDEVESELVAAVCSDGVTVKYLGSPAIDCTDPKVVAEIHVRVLVTASLSCCCTK